MKRLKAIVTLVLLLGTLARLSQAADINNEYLTQLRDKIRKAWCIPDDRGPLNVEEHGLVDGPWFRIVKLSYQAEASPLNRITGNLYLPKDRKERVPGVILNMGHQGSKWASAYSQYAGQLITYLGGVCLTFDVIGEEERHVTGRTAAQGHDMYDQKQWREGSPNNRAVATDYQLGVMKRSVSGKLVLDAVRSLDLLASRAEVNPNRLGVFGSSLGGQITFWTTALDTRVKVGVVSGWALANVTDAKQLRNYMACAQSGIRLAYAIEPRMEALLSLTAPHARVLFINGEKEPWANLITSKQVFDRAQPFIADRQTWKIMPGGHRHNELSVPSIAMLEDVLRFPNTTPEKLAAMPTVDYGKWCEASIAKEAIASGRIRIYPYHYGVMMPKVAAVWYPRATLACFGTGSAGPDYTFIGWRQRCVELAKQ